MNLKTLPKGLLPILIIVIGVIGAVVMLKLKPEPPRRPGVNIRPLVRVEAISGQEPEIVVQGYGEVNARRKIDLTARVAGRVIQTSPALQDGAVFSAGDTLLIIEQDDYRLARDMAAAGVANAEFSLARAEQEAEIARREWNDQNAATDGASRARPNPLVLHGPQLKLARANLGSAIAVLEQAELNLERCLVIAPFSGRVIRETVDVGQYLGPGAVIGSIYATDRMDIVVPVDDMDLALFNAPSADRRIEGAAVDVLAEFAGKPRRWTGRVLRTAGAVDRQSRMVDVVIGVDNSRQDEGVPPLLEGMFVDVRIAGHQLPGTLAIPRAALHAGDTVWIVDDQDILSIREVDVAFKDREQVVLSGGVSPGERLVVSQMDVVSDGMVVRTGQKKPTGAGEPQGAGDDRKGGGEAK